jgi:hypothetical protein
MGADKAAASGYQIESHACPPIEPEYQAW